MTSVPRRGVPKTPGCDCGNNDLGFFCHMPRCAWRKVTPYAEYKDQLHLMPVVEDTDPPGVLYTPLVGSSVHYLDGTGNGECNAATITYVHKAGDENWVDEEVLLFGVPGAYWVDLHVMFRTRCMPLQLVCQDDRTKSLRTWHWPERY